MRYRIETWVDSTNVHYTDILNKQQVRANLMRTSHEVCLDVLRDLERDHVDVYLDFAHRTFTVNILDK